MDTADQLLAVLDAQPGERILDLGCGIGTVTAKLAAAGARVTGLEIVGPLLEQARMRYPGITFVEGSLLEYLPGEPYDAVFAHAVLHWIKPPERAIEQIHKCLRAGGRVAGTLGSHNEVARQLDGYYMPNPRKYKKLIEKSGFCDVEVEPVDGVLFVYAVKRG